MHRTLFLPEMIGISSWAEPPLTWLKKAAVDATPDTRQLGRKGMRVHADGAIDMVQARECIRDSKGRQMTIRIPAASVAT